MIVRSVRISFILFFLLGSVIRPDTPSFILSSIPPILWVGMMVLKRWHLPLLILASMFCWFLVFFRVGAEGRALVATIPPIGSGSDELMFLRTFHLFQGNGNYYRSYFQATIEGMTGRHLTTDVLTWRLPTLTMLWSLFFDNGIQTQYAFIFLSLLLIPLSVLLFRGILQPPLALLGGLLLMPYAADALAYRTGFLFHEWWGFFAFIVGLSFLKGKKYLLSFLFLSLSLLIRELFLLPTVLLFLFALVSRQKKEALLFLGVMMIFVGAFFLHAQHILSFPDALQAIPRSRLHSFELPHFQRMIAFSMRQYMLTPLFVNRMLLFLSFSAIPLMFYRGSKQAGTVLLAFLLTGVSFAFVGNVNNDYWGIVFFPILILGSILIIQPTIKRNDKKLIPSATRRSGVS